MSEYLYIDSARVDAERLEPFAQGLTSERRAVLQPLLTFLEEWWGSEEYVTVQTSGSTGTPKQIRLTKCAMRRSGLRSNRYFQIDAGKRLLLAMDLRYIGAKMMVVRALLAGAELIVVPPSSHPLATRSVAPQFVSLVPLQLHHTLEVPAERELLSQAEQLIIGGGAIHPAVEAQLSTLPVAAYATYGMTETISHIALRRLNGPHA
ncbi:AMP-binding protein, partial [Porphyromonas sp.]|uniref:AMP-binding protein n=1 Tax=Porphyromonas sp. TaxID=1924944 RepID=UPI0025F35AC4